MWEKREHSVLQKKREIKLNMKLSSKIELVEEDIFLHAIFVMKILKVRKHTLSKHKEVVSHVYHAEGSENVI